ncbi:MAG: sigma-70 family RNA polymerase sigma factor [Anaerolineales bacterium]|nr:sigma-70 family RNA polymerase sigma factor [Anaerolineales bacterium]
MAVSNLSLDQRPEPEPDATRPVATSADAEAALEAAFAEHYARVYGVLFRLLGERAAAEDLALETFWRLWQRTPRDRANLGGWLYRVALRLGYNALRAARRRAHYELAAGVAAWEQSAPPDPARAVELAEERARVRAALAQLPERDAHLLMLREAGLSYKELAAAVGVAPGSVGTLLHRAAAAFEQAYGPPGHGDAG